MTDDTDDNIRAFPTPDDQLAAQIKAAWERTKRGHEEWIEGSLELGARMLEGRDKMGHIEFGAWLARRELDYLEKNNRAAIIEMARNPNRFREVLEETDRTSYELILRKEFRVPIDRKTEMANIDAPAALPDPKESREVVVHLGERQLLTSDEEDEPKPHKRRGRKPGKVSTARLATRGEAGQFLDQWLRAAVPPGRVAPLFAIMALGNYKQNVLDEIADFVKATPDLPPPFIGLRHPTPALFWREMPQQLVDQIMRRVPYKKIHKKKDEEGPTEEPDYPRILLETIDAWPRQIAKVHADWVAAGRPLDSRMWYLKHVSGQNAGSYVAVAQPTVSLVPPSPELLASLPPAMAELLDDNRPYENHHDGFQPAKQGEIRAYGAEIWPRPRGARWTFLEAFYAFHLWHELQPLMKEERPKERARALMNPFRVIIANLSGGVAAALHDILTAQFDHPDRHADTRAPSKRLNFQD